MSHQRKICAVGLTSLLAAWGCFSTKSDEAAEQRTRESVAAWSTIYGVLQHPRCANCHPPDGIPRQGDAGLPHMQNVQGGPEGKGRFAQLCETCHQSTNLPGEHMPPGAPTWHLPPPETPMVFIGMGPGELCRQLKDKKRNGGKSPEQLFEHMAHDPLVLWGWSPGEGRNPVSTPHDELVRAMRTWIDGGCGCPK